MPRSMLCSVVAALAFAGMASTAYGDLVSHRALYTMSLQSSTRSSDVAELEGRMALELAEGCDGWTLDQRIALLVENFDGDAINSYTTFTSWESKDGKEFLFEQQVRHDGAIVEELSGRAVILDEAGGVATLTKPEDMEIALPPGTIFPGEHTELLLAAAAAGESRVSRIVFDGTTVDNPNLVSAYIGRPRPAASTADDAAEARVWPVRLAFFPLDTALAEPDVEIGLMMQADGVVRAVELDYGSFVIEGELDRFETIDPAGC